MAEPLEPLAYRYLREANQANDELAGWRNDFHAIAEALGLPEDVGRADLVYAAAELKARVEYLNGQEAGWARIAITADCERDRLCKEAASFLESAATYQDRPGAMAEHEAMAAKIREVLAVPPSVKAARVAKEEKR